MKTFRIGTFETNSSSCHSLTTLSKDEILDFSRNQWTKCIHLPDCETYSIDPNDWGHTYEILTYEEALDKYNKIIDVVEAQYQKHLDDYMEGRSKWEPHPCGFEKIKDTDDFREAVEKRILDVDPVFGLYLSFGDFMAHAVIESDMKFDVQWWNNC